MLGKLGNKSERKFETCPSPGIVIGCGVPIDTAILHLPADTWMPTGEQQIPTGRRPVDATPYDFRTAHEIGDQLALSPKTVETYRQRIMAKLALEGRHDLVRYALRVGLLVPEGE